MCTLLPIDLAAASLLSLPPTLDTPLERSLQAMQTPCEKPTEAGCRWPVFHVRTCSRFCVAASCFFSFCFSFPGERAPLGCFADLTALAAAASVLLGNSFEHW